MYIRYLMYLITQHLFVCLCECLCSVSVIPTPSWRGLEVYRCWWSVGGKARTYSTQT